MLILFCSDKHTHPQSQPPPQSPTLGRSAQNNGEIGRNGRSNEEQMRSTSGPANHRHPGGLSDGQADHTIASDGRQETSPTASSTEHTDDSIEDSQRRPELLHLRPSQTTVSATQEAAPQASSETRQARLLKLRKDTVLPGRFCSRRLKRKRVLPRTCWGPIRWVV